MKFNQLYTSFPKFFDTLASPFSGRKRKRDQADIVDDSLSARALKQSAPAQLSSPHAPATSNQSNTRDPAVTARTQASLPHPADLHREATSQSAQDVPKIRQASGQPADSLQAVKSQGLQSESGTDQLRRIERELAELKQKFDKMTGDPAAQPSAAAGSTINLQARDQLGKLVELSRRRDAQTAQQHTNRQQTPRADNPIVLDDAEDTPMPKWAPSHSYCQHGSTSGQQRWEQHQQPSIGNAGYQSAAVQNSPQLHARLLNSASKQSAAFGPKFIPTTAGSSPYLRSPNNAFGSPQIDLPWYQRPRQKPFADPDSKLTEMLEELHMHQPYNPLSPMTAFASKQQIPKSSPAGQDLDEVLAKAKRSISGASQSSLKAATEQAQQIVEHKSLMRRSQTDAQPPLPHLDARGATAAQSRLRTAAEPQKAAKGKQALPRKAVAKGRRSLEDEGVDELTDGTEYAEDGDEEGASSAIGSSDQDESGLSEAFSELGPRAGQLEPVRKPSQAMLQLRDKAFANGPDTEKLIVHVHSGVDVLRKDIKTLKPRQWLNDEIMNVYMGLLQERDVKMRKLGGFPKCHFFNTFFINKLYKDDEKYLYNNVRRWTSKMRLERWGQPSATVLECDKLIIPVHLGCHWTCAVINLKDHEIWYFDSLGGKEPEIIESLARYATDEYENKLKQKVDTSAWVRRSPADIPKQLNGCDCGVFALMFAEYQSRGAPFTFDQRHMEYYRVKVLADIMSEQIEIPQKPRR